MADKSGDMLVGLDIGSSKVVCAIASPLSQNSFRIEGIGQCPSAGIREGSVVEINHAMEAIRTAVEAAEKDAQTTVDHVTAGISGPHIVSENIEVMVPTNQEEVTKENIAELTNNAQIGNLPPSMRYLTVIPQDYAVDKEWGKRNPEGLSGKRLDGRLHLVTAPTNACQNLSKAIRRSGLELPGNLLSFAPLSTAAAILTPEERRLGVCMIDIGAQLCDVAVFYDDAIQFSHVLPMGGNDITYEISVKTTLPADGAEQLKLKMGLARFDPSKDANTSCRLPTYAGFSREGGRLLSRQALSGIIDTRLEDILEKIYYKLRDKGFHNQLGYGVVLTGGGARLEGIERMAKEVFSSHMAGRDLNVRIGRPYIDFETKEFFSPEAYSRPDFPNRLTGYSTPDHATVMGYLCEDNRRFWTQGSNPAKGSPLRSWINEVKSWILGNF